MIVKMSIEMQRCFCKLREVSYDVFIDVVNMFQSSTRCLQKLFDIWGDITSDSLRRFRIGAISRYTILWGVQLPFFSFQLVLCWTWVISTHNFCNNHIGFPYLKMHKRQHGFLLVGLEYLRKSSIHFSKATLKMAMMWNAQHRAPLPLSSDECLEDTGIPRGDIEVDNLLYPLNVLPDVYILSSLVTQFQHFPYSISFVSPPTTLLI